MIDCRVLGAPLLEARRGGVPRELSWKKHLAMLVYLQRSRDRRRTREHLMALLWEGAGETQARHSLREALRIFRRALGDDAVAATGDWIQLETTEVEFDTDLFQARAAADDWRGASQLVRGPFMEGFSVADAPAFEEWLVGERAAWTARSLEALVRCAAQHVETNAVEDAFEMGKRAIELDGSSEDGVLALVESAALLGRTDEAFAAVRAYGERLATVGRSPSEAVRTMEARVRAIHRAPPDEPDEATKRQRLSLVGRSDELRRLVGWWEESRSTPQASLVILDGASGLGKTRLTEELAKRATLAGATTLHFQGVPADRAEPWSGLAGLARGGLADAAGIGGASHAALAAVAERVPEWLDRFPGARNAMSHASPGQALSDIMAALLSEQATLLVMDDAHWVDADTLQAIRAATRDHQATPLCVVLSMSPSERSEVTDVLRASVGRDVLGETITLSALDLAAVTELTSEAFPRYDTESRARLARRIMADSAGIPLLAVELLHAVALGLELGEAAQTWPTSDRTLDSTLPSDLPTSVVAAIRIGFRRLSHASQDVLRIAAVLEGRVPADVFAGLMDVDERELDHALDELEWHRWLTCTPRGYTFVAGLFRDVIAQDFVGTRQRKRILREESARAAGSVI